MSTRALKVGDKVSSSNNRRTGEVVAILSKPDYSGNTRAILANNGAIFLCRDDGSNLGSFCWNKAKRKVKRTVYINFYKHAHSFVYDTAEKAATAAASDAEAVAVPAECEYEVED